MSTDRIKSLHDLVHKAIDANDVDKVIEICTEIITLDSKDAKAFANRAIAYAATHDFTKALRDHAEEIALKPDSDAYGNRARTYAESGHPKRAIPDFDKAIELNPSDSGNYSDRGSCYLELDEHKQALNDFNTAILLDSTNLNAFGNRGNVYDAMGNFEDAIADFTTVLKLNPTDIFALVNRSNEYYKLKEFVLAISDITTALDEEPENLQLYFNRADAYKANGEVDKAISDSSKVIENGDDLLIIEALLLRAELYVASKKNESAEKDRIKAMELKEKFEFAEGLRSDDALLELIQRSCPLEVARLIDHSFSGTKQEMQKIQKRLKAVGIDGKIHRNDDEHSLEMSEMYIPKDIKTRTTQLRKLAIEVGASYDGWGTSC